MLREIRNQPPHIRAIFMWLSVFIVFSLVIFVWLKSFQQKITFLLNPLEEAEIVKNESPISTIRENFNDLGATILDLFGLASGTKNETEVRSSLEERAGMNIQPRLLPLSEDKSND